MKKLIFLLLLWPSGAQGMQVDTAALLVYLDCFALREATAVKQNNCSQVYEDATGEPTPWTWLPVMEKRSALEYVSQTTNGWQSAEEAADHITACQETVRQYQEATKACYRKLRKALRGR